MLKMGRKGRRGTCRDTETQRSSVQWQNLNARFSSASSYHEGDLLGGLRLPADHQDAAAEDEETHGQQHQDPDLQRAKGLKVICGEIADDTHDHHCDCREKTGEKLCYKSTESRLLRQTETHRGR